jgi:C-terminal processing protease CtpA/Prc
MANRIDSETQEIYKNWLDNATPAVKQQLIRPRPISRFNQDANNPHKKKNKLSRQQRLRIIDQALVLLDQTYVHLPLKRALHAIDPVQRLKNLRFQVSERGQPAMSPIEFHREMQEVFASLRDRHTQYTLPTPFDGYVAFLPFLIEEYFENGDPRYMVSHVAKGFVHRTFKRGVDVVRWNGVPIHRAIDINGDLQGGSNPEARHARGLDALTIRELSFGLPPDEESVVVAYKSGPNKPEKEIKLQWLVVTLSAGKRRHRRRRSGLGSAPKLAIDKHKARINQMRKILYAPDAVAAEKKAARYKKWYSPSPDALETSLPAMFLAKRVLRGEFGLIRIFTFAPDIDGSDEVVVQKIVTEFVRLITELRDTDGLIIDVRGNGGGYIEAAERSLQLFTPRSIDPELFEFRNTPLTLDICRVARKDKEMSQFARSISESMKTGGIYSGGFPLTSKEACNAIGQQYYGPVVLITDALCYSATDMFTAGFRDNYVGKILGTSGNTGAGGANVWELGDLIDWMRQNRRSPFKRLPKGSGMRVAIRRSLRVGKQIVGQPLEALGVTPNPPTYQMTKRDLKNNRDLIERAGELLKSQPARKLSAERVVNRDGSNSMKIYTQNIDQLRAYLDGQPKKLSPITRNRRSNGATYMLDLPQRQGRGQERALRLEGFNRSNRLVAVYRQEV